MQAIAFTGLARSGKDTAADYLVKKYGFKKLVLSEQTITELENEGKPLTKINRSLMAESLRKRFGEKILAKRALEKAKERNLQKAVFTGVHQTAEVEFFKKNIEDFNLVAVKANPKKRFGRRTELDAQSEESFFERDRHDTKKFELGKVIDRADHTIENNSTINDLHRSIDELMQKI